MKQLNKIKRISQPQGILKPMAVIHVFLLMFASNSVFADDIKDAKKATSAFFKQQSFTAKIDLQTTSEYHVTPDGRPVNDKEQGRSKKNLGIGQRDVAFATGAGGKGIYVSVKKRKKQIIVSLLPRRGPTMHQAKMFINFDRAIEATDVTPEVIARALVSYVEFTGVEVGSELNAAMQKLSVDGESPDKTNSVESVSFDNVTVTATPSQVARGENVSLDIEFDILGSDSQMVEETRTLKFNGQMLPGFPKENSIKRTVANHVSRYKQPIPANASVGVYSYKGEVCVSGACTSRTVSFTVE